MADQDGLHSDIMMQRHVMSSAHDTDAKGDICRHTFYYLPSLVVIAFIFSGLRTGGGGGDGRSPV